MVREARILQAVRPHFPLVPKVYCLEESPEVLGTPFFVMEHLEGLVPTHKFPVQLSAEQAHKLCQNLISLHADLHAVDLQATGLHSLGKPEGYVERQIDRSRSLRLRLPSAWSHPGKAVVRTPKKLDW